MKRMLLVSTALAGAIALQLGMEPPRLANHGSPPYTGAQARSAQGAINIARPNKELTPGAIRTTSKIEICGGTVRSLQIRFGYTTTIRARLMHVHPAYSVSISWSELQYTPWTIWSRWGLVAKILPQTYGRSPRFRHYARINSNFGCVIRYVCIPTVCRTKIVQR
jgi:hypothetical protein